MNTALFVLIASIACIRAEDITYTLVEGTSGWSIANVQGVNPDITVSVGDNITFDVSGITTNFGILVNNSTDLYPTEPAELTADGTLFLEVGEDVAGQILSYGSETDSSLQGHICVLPSNCATVGECGGLCTSCNSGWNLVAGACVAPTPTPNPGDNCTAPSNCADYNCLGLQVQCVQCNSGYWINSDGACTRCGSCGNGEWITYPCDTYNDVNCAACTPCEPGQETIEACDGTQTSDSTVCGGSSGNSTNCPNVDDHCLSAQCWNENGAVITQCTNCSDGYWIGADWRCHACRDCNVGEFISYPCGGWTATVCSPCTTCDILWPGGVTIEYCPGDENADASVCAQSGASGIAGCISADDSGCTQCGLGYYLDVDNSTGNLTACAACGECDDGDFVSQSCSGTSSSNDQICSPCGRPEGCTHTVCQSIPYCEACSPGYVLEQDGTCTPLNCNLYGCGVATNATCVEWNSTTYACNCYDGNQTIITIGGSYYNGICGNLSPEEIVARINWAQLEIFLMNGILEVSGVVEVGVDGSSFTLNINTTTTVEDFSDVLAAQIARYLGGGYTADDITIEIAEPSNKRQTSTSELSHSVSITVGADVNPASTLALNFWIVAVLALFFSFF